MTETLYGTFEQIAARICNLSHHKPATVFCECGGRTTFSLANEPDVEPWLSQHIGHGRLKVWQTDEY